MKSPVLFIVFNRPDTTQKVFEEIAKAKPGKLYVAADGPRKDKLGERELCELTRQISIRVNWPCEVLTRFQDNNLGCKCGVSSAIDWFFENEEEGIILEDDVVPRQDFFEYCDLVLNYYRNDERVFMATGTNYFSDMDATDPIFFSQHFSIWGWATWKRAWEYYDVEMGEWKKEKIKKKFEYQFGANYIWRHFQDVFNSLQSTFSDTWDIQWVFACLNNSGLCITPKVNLISNIGVVGTHGNVVTDSHFIKSLPLSIKEEQLKRITVTINSEYDQKLHKVKNLPTQRRKLAINFFKKIGLYVVLRKLKNKIWQFI
jgi:hypothetical protein